MYLLKSLSLILFACFASVLNAADDSTAGASTAVSGVAAGLATGSSSEAAYKVLPGDQLVVSVWDEPELRSEVVVLPDNSLSFPLVGTVNVAGMTISRIQEKLTSQLSKFIPDANVHVAMTKLNGSKFYVLGKVNRPGEFPLDRGIDVLQALSIAGGLSTFADESEIKIIRRDGETQLSLPISYEKLMDGESLDSNITLVAGDLVVVP